MRFNRCDRVANVCLFWFRFDNISKLIEVDGIIYHISLSYTVNHKDYDELRILSYPNVRGYVIFHDKFKIYER